MAFNNLLIQRDLKIEASIEDLFVFAKERESIRKKKEAGQPQDTWTEDAMLKTGRFINIFREDDKTTKVIFDAAKAVEGRERWRAIFIGRYINRVDRLSVLYPLQDNLSDQLIATVDPDIAITNACAYQLHSGIGKIFKVKGAKTAVHHLDGTIDATYEAIQSATNIVEGTAAVNKAFGGYINFMAYQCVLDWAQVNRVNSLLISDPYEGIGASATGSAVGLDARGIAEAQPIHWPDAKRKMLPFDAENLMCEFRKYHKRKQDGIQSATSKYKPNFLGAAE